MKKYDFVVSSYEYEYIADTLEEAKKIAFKLAIKTGYADINKWNLVDGEMVLDENFFIEITYKG